MSARRGRVVLFKDVATMKPSSACWRSNRKKRRMSLRTNARRSPSRSAWARWPIRCFRWTTTRISSSTSTRRCPSTGGRDRISKMRYVRANSILKKVERQTFNRQTLDVQRSTMN
ncbi:MAG: hypothetical protein MZV64_17665 [Ignavibacteriales bacterium]|nr:hypothetical protein [Ignavibacteriales bacterium]